MSAGVAAADAVAAAKTAGLVVLAADGAGEIDLSRRGRDIVGSHCVALRQRSVGIAR